MVGLARTTHRCLATGRFEAPVNPSCSRTPTNDTGLFRVHPSGNAGDDQENDTDDDDDQADQPVHEEQER